MKAHEDGRTAKNTKQPLPGILFAGDSMMFHGCWKFCAVINKTTTTNQHHKYSFLEHCSTLPLLIIVSNHDSHRCCRKQWIWCVLLQLRTFIRFPKHPYTYVLTGLHLPHLLGKTTFLNDTTKSHKCTYIRQYHNIRPYVTVSKIPNFDPKGLPYWEIYEREEKDKTIKVGGTMAGEFTGTRI